MGNSVDKSHPLEGEHIIYNYGVQDSLDEGWALALYKLEDRKLREIYHPGDRVLQESDIGERQIDELLELMKKREIRKVYSVWHLDDFFGIPFNFISLHEPNEEPEEIEYWAEWKHLEREGREHNNLKRAGIEVIFWEEPRK
jgi:hypothetical protein